MHIELVTETHYESLIDLLLELHSYYNEGSTLARSFVQLHLVQNILAADSPQKIAVAINDSGIVLGFAAFSLSYSLVEAMPDKNRRLQLKELYVRSDSRGFGVGKAIFTWLAQYAIDHNCCRMDWPVKRSNERGIAFYESLSAQLVDERLSYRLSESSLRSLAAA